jgi:hypothetical protein
MLNRTIFFLLLLFANISKVSADDLRISLLTCGTGDQIWEIFGHAAIRVTDARKGIDEVYNYGTFDGYEEGFEWKFMQGKLLYYVSHYPYRYFLDEYKEAGRSVYEQELLADSADKAAIYEFLQWNALRENKYYRYDFLYDNCATRIRDIFPDILGSRFQYQEQLPDAYRDMSFRQLINIYFYKNHFTRTGVNLLLGSGVDKKMDAQDIMFLPDFLREAASQATIGSQKAFSNPKLILAGNAPTGAGINWVWVITLGIFILVSIGYITPSLLPLSKFMGNLLLFVTGALGCIMMFMWLGTSHTACSNNFNLLWALPTNIILAFAPKKKKGAYAVMAMLLLFFALILHITGVQELALLELSPLFLSLLFIYSIIYRRNRIYS